MPQHYLTPAESHSQTVPFEIFLSKGRQIVTCKSERPLQYPLISGNGIHTKGFRDITWYIVSYLIVIHPERQHYVADILSVTLEYKVNFQGKKVFIK